MWSPSCPQDSAHIIAPQYLRKLRSAEQCAALPVPTLPPGGGFRSLDPRIGDTTLMLQSPPPMGILEWRRSGSQFLRETTQWGTTLSSRVNVHHAICAKALSSANLVMQPSTSSPVLLSSLELSDTRSLSLNNEPSSEPLHIPSRF